MGITSAYGKVSEAKYSEGGIYVLPGVYQFRVDACKHIKIRSGAEAFVVELTVLESNNPERAVGSQCSWMVTLDKEPALGNVKQFVTAATEFPDSAINEEAILLIVGEKNPLKGTILRCSANVIKTKAGRDFTKVKWFSDGDGAQANADFAKGNQ